MIEQLSSEIKQLQNNQARFTDVIDKIAALLKRYSLNMDIENFDKILIEYIENLQKEREK